MGYAGFIVISVFLVQGCTDCNRFDSMSSKNLKVYKMVFITELRRLFLNVKFACKVRCVWKRSNESTETPFVPLEAGVVNFNQTLRLNVNMYLDTTTNKFVEKKCLYSFTISTEKGDKSAGSVAIDLAEFFNNRVYEMEQSWVLEKCPVAGTKVEMKVHYEEDVVEQGYDSMSCISVNNPMDSSTASVDISELGPTGSNISEKEEETQKSSKSDISEKREQVGVRGELLKEEGYATLSAADVAEPLGVGSDGSKIGQNIKSINTLALKIDQFVNDKSKNIKFQMEGFRRKINGLQQQLQTGRVGAEKLQSQLAQQRKRGSELQRQYMHFREEAEHRFDVERRRAEELQSRCGSQEKLLTQMEAKMNSSGQSQGEYIQQLKAGHAQTEAKLREEVQELRLALVEEKKIKNQLNARVNELEGALGEAKEKCGRAAERNQILEGEARRNEAELELTRTSLQRAFESLVSALNGVV